MAVMQISQEDFAAHENVLRDMHEGSTLREHFWKAMILLLMGLLMLTMSTCDDPCCNAVFSCNNLFLFLADALCPHEDTPAHSLRVGVSLKTAEHYSNLGRQSQTY